MASANTELVRSIYAGWERGDFGSADWADPEIEFEIVGGAESNSGRGVSAMAELWRGFLEPWEELRVEAEQVRDLGGGRVLVLTQNTGRGKASGLELGRISTPGANLFEIRGGRVTRLILYPERARALAVLDAEDRGDPGDS